MNKKRNAQPQPSQAAFTRTPVIPEDWLAVILGFALCLLAVIGLIGPKFINITF